MRAVLLPAFGNHNLQGHAWSKTFAKKWATHVDAVMRIEIVDEYRGILEHTNDPDLSEIEVRTIPRSDLRTLTLRRHGSEWTTPP